MRNLVSVDVHESVIDRVAVLKPLNPVTALGSADGVPVAVAAVPHSPLYASTVTVTETSLSRSEPSCNFVKMQAMVSGLHAETSTFTGGAEFCTAEIR